jgi:hypothetical protein
MVLDLLLLLPRSSFLLHQVDKLVRLLFRMTRVEYTDGQDHTTLYLLYQMLDIPHPGSGLPPSA